MIKLLWYSIRERWKAVGWQTPLPTLDRHLEHIAGGGLVVMIAGLFLGQFDSHMASTLLFFSVEFILTPILRAGLYWNWRDSVMDFWQYCFHWVIFLFPLSLVWFGVGFAVWLVFYFILLLKGW